MTQQSLPCPVLHRCALFLQAVDIYHIHKFVKKAAANVTKEEKKGFHKFKEPPLAHAVNNVNKTSNHSLILPGLVTGLGYSSESAVAHIQRTGVKEKNPQIEEASLSARRSLAPALPLSPSAGISV